VLIPVLILVDYLHSDPEALRLLIKLYIERSHSVWKEPEVSSLELVRGAPVTQNSSEVTQCWPCCCSTQWVAMLLFLFQVLTWLEANARRVIARVDSRDTLVEDCARKYENT